MAMNARTLGNGNQTLVLAHGYGGSQAIWDNIVPTLAEKYRILVFDWSFSGAVEEEDSDFVFDSSKYSSYYGFVVDLISLVEGLKMKDVVFVGHSMSGMIGCIASVERPDLFSRLVLVAASPRYINTGDYEGGFDQTSIDAMLANIGPNFHAWAEGFVPAVVGADDPISIKKFGHDFKRMKPSTALCVARAIFLSDHRDILERVVIPCTIVQGTNDVAAPVSVGHYLKSKIKGASLEIMEMDGHCPQLTVPDKLVDVIERAMS